VFEVDHQYDWRDILIEQQHATRSEIPPEDLGYSPVPKFCLANLSMLQPGSPAIRRTLNQMHPHLTKEVKSVLAGEGCATVEEAVTHFPVLRGLTNDELNRLRRCLSISVGAASKELLCARTVLEESTVDRYFRPKEFLPR
jgi:hypothetical protein